MDVHEILPPFGRLNDKSKQILMIPKIIHYCWFGGNPLPESAKKCIASWKKYLPDYQIWQWSEKPSHDNANHNPNGLSPTHPLGEGEKNGKENDLFDKILEFDVNSIPYTQQAYEAKKYAFVSDYARFWILYKYGGLYFDTDVEIIKLERNVPQRVRMFIWLEGQDIDCSDKISSARFAVSIELAGGDQ